MPVRRHPEERSHNAAVAASMAPPSIPSPQSDPPSPTDEVERSSRSTPSVVAFVLVAMVLIVTLGSWLNANEERSAPAAPIDAAAQDTPAGDGSPNPVVSPGPGSLVRIDATTGQILASVPMPSPKLLAADGDSVWVLGERGTKLFRVDAGTNASRSFEVGGAAEWLAAAGGSVWLSDNGELYRLAPGASTVEWANSDVRALGNLAPDSLVGAKGSFWMSWFPPGGCCVMRRMDLYRVDPATGEVIATIEGATQVVASGTGFVWAAVNVRPTEGLRLVRIDMETYATEPIGVLELPWADLTVADGAVWASSLRGNGTIVRLDPVTGEARERIRVGKEPGALEAGGGAVWAAIRKGGSIARYDMETGRIQMIDVGGTPHDLAFAHGSVWVAVTSVGTGPSVTVPGVPEGDYVIDLNTGVRTPLPEAIIRSLGGTAEGEGAESHYAASPDGSQLAYVGTGEEGSPQIFIAGIDGTGIRQMTHHPVGAGSPAWSPDGTSIAYQGGGGDRRDLYVLDVASGKSTQIADGVVPWGFGLQFTPDGSSLVYTGGSDPEPEMRTVPVAGGKSTILFGGGHGGMGGAGDGSLSPDGSLVTMMGHEVGGPGAIRFVANADGTELRQIAGRGSNPAGTWSPDGSQIVCLQRDARRSGIIVVDISTGEVLPVSEGSEAIWLDDHTLLVEA
jgi:hypothetical protein